MGTGLYFVKWDDHILEENNMLISQGDSKTRNDTCENIEKLGCSIEFMAFVDEGIEAFIDCLSNHLSSWHKLKYYFLSEIIP